MDSETNFNQIIDICSISEYDLLETEVESNTDDLLNEMDEAEINYSTAYNKEMNPNNSDIDMEYYKNLEPVYNNKIIYNYPSPLYVNL